MIHIEHGHPEFNVHLIDSHFKVLKTTVKRSITRKAIVGQYAPKLLNIKDRRSYCRKIKRVLKLDTVEFCSYRVRDQLFVAKMETQDPDTVSIVEWNITGMSAEQVFDIEWW